MNEETERARAKFAAAGMLSTVWKAPPGTLPLTEEELIELGTLPPGSPSILDMVNEDRGGTRDQDMTFQKIVDEFDQLSIDEKLQVIEYLASSIRETLQSQTKSDGSRADEPHNHDNSSDTDAATPIS